MARRSGGALQGTIRVFQDGFNGACEGDSERFSASLIGGLQTSCGAFLALLGILALFLAGNASAQPSASLAVYNDAACMVLTSGIVWGVLQNATSYERVVYVKNLESQDLTGISVAIAQTEPSNLANNLILSYSYPVADLPLKSQESIKLTLDLRVNSHDPNLSAFSFNIVINAEYGGAGTEIPLNYGSGAYVVQAAASKPSDPAPANNWGIGLLFLAAALVVFLRTGGGRKHR